MIKKYSVVLLMITTISLLSAHNFHGAAMAPNSLNGWVVTIDTPMVFYTPDGGHNWINRSFLDALSYFDVFALNSQKVWIGGVQGFIHYSPNQGQNWYVQRMGLSKWTARIFFLNDTLGWAACGSAIIGKTIHGSDTIYQMDLWEQINLTNPPFSADSCDIYGIHFINENIGWFCAGRYPENDTEYIKGQGYIAKTTDGGSNPLTWQLLLRDTINDFFDIKFIDALHGIVVGGNDRTNAGIVLKTQDGGITWQPVTVPPGTKILRALELVGNTHLWAVGRNGTIIKSTDGGNTWTAQISGVDTTLFDVDFADTLNGLIAGNGYVLYTHNGGTTWYIANVYGIEEPSDKMTNLNQNSLVRVNPNPFYNQITINIPTQNLNDNVCQIYDIMGNLVRTINVTTPSIIWNGKDMHSRYVPAGVYFIKVEFANRSSITPVIFVR